MNNDLNKPYSYNEWLSYQGTLLPESAETEYLTYVKKWYFDKTKNKNSNIKSIKEDYIQLLKDLSFLFGNDEIDRFLLELDYYNDEELIYAIPLFAKKLKQLSLVFAKKRESVKQAKLKYNLIGSNVGLEKLLYEYILKGFSKTNNITQVPTFKFSNIFPDLSSVKDNFYIEIEELHDKNTYLGKDSSVSIENYIDISKLDSSTLTNEFVGLNNDEILKLASFGYLTKISNSYLSNVFVDFLTNEVPSLTSDSLFNNRVLNVYNQIEASKKYISEPLYGLTAIKLKETTTFDNSLSLDFNFGNNWFYWPSGVRVLDDAVFNNTFLEIPINNSNFLGSGATAGDDYTNSDLIFTDKSGLIEGAWLQGFYKTQPEIKDMILTIQPGQKKEFIFPFVGVDFSTKTSSFLGYKITDEDNVLLDSLNPKTKEEILIKYFSNSLPTSSCNPIYLNNSKLIFNGAYADTFSDTADNIIKKQRETSESLYAEELNGEIEQSYLYKFDKTDIAISPGINNIYWPLQKYEANENINLTLNHEFCTPMYLRDLDVNKTMVGAIAGNNINTSDIIYKLSDKNGTETTECAWLGSPSITRLDLYKNIKPIYNKNATKCSQFIDGPIQSSLFLNVSPNKKESFIWMDEDTYADDVFKFINHLPSCPYLKQVPNDYYSDQDYQNASPINDIKHWKKCNCKSIHYSPIGHSGDNVYDYNGMADYLFADPDGVGEEFAINSWSDTRELDAYNSPQFSYFKLSNDDEQSDINVGWGNGKWQTGNNARMVLKTGRRYTYYRTSLRTSDSQSPYFVNKYIYKNINGLIGDTDGFDLVIIIDNSKSQSLNLDTTKKCVNAIVDKILPKNNVQISLVEFNSVANRLCYLSSQKDPLKLFVSQIQTPTDPELYNSYIKQALILAESILTQTIQTDSVDSSFRLACSNLGYLITDLAVGNNIQNLPQTGKPKKILIFSDGLDNGFELDENNISNPNYVSDYFTKLKEESNIDIYAVDIGKRTLENNVLIKAASSFSTYFNLESFLNNGDGNINSFIDYMSMRLYGNMPIMPIWYKGYRDVFGTWKEKYDKFGNLEVSDMQLRAGDYISYVHRSHSSYTNEDNTLVDFKTKSLSFTINAKLNGWNYNTNTFSLSNFGDNCGAKPFWAIVNVRPNETDNFRKDTISFGGKIKFVDDYLPVQQPDVSTMVLSAGSFFEYYRNTVKPLVWKQPISLYNTISSFRWNKLIFKKDFSNLKEFLYKQDLDGVLYPTNDPSDLILEGYSSFKPVFFNYYARNAFTYNQGLYNKKRCLESFVVYNTGILIEPLNAFENLVNNFTPDVATIPMTYNVVSEKEYGSYMLPENLGVPYFRGKGYDITIDNDRVTLFKEISSEITYFEIGKYGPRQRGLTKKDQLSITKINNIDYTWLLEPYSSADKSGVIVNTLENQKLTPYQSTYEILGKNNYGVSRQDDEFQMWNPPIPPVWSDPIKYPLSFRKELLLDSYVNRKDKLLVNKGKLQNWKTDIFGTNYGLYKKFKPNDINDILFWFSADTKAITQTAFDIYDYDKYAVNGERIKKWGDKTGRQRDLNSYYGKPRYIDFSSHGKPSIIFDGEEGLDNLRLNYELDTNNLSFFIVAKFLNRIGNNPNVLFSMGERLFNPNDTTYQNPSLVISNNLDKLNFIFGNTATEENVILSNDDKSLDLNKFHLFEMHYDAPNCYSYVDGELFADTESSGDELPNGIYANEGFWVGSYIAGAFSSRCEISEIICYTRSLKSREISNIRNYINDIYSIY
jgi:hypothetical protein